MRHGSQWINSQTHPRSIRDPDRPLPGAPGIPVVIKLLQGHQLPSLQGTQGQPSLAWGLSKTKAEVIHQGRRRKPCLGEVCPLPLSLAPAQLPSLPRPPVCGGVS